MGWLGGGGLVREKGGRGEILGLVVVVEIWWRV